MNDRDKRYSFYVIEDSRRDFLLVEDYLNEQFNLPSITRASTFAEARDVFTDIPGDRFDCIMLDLSLPDKSGEELIESVIKMGGDTPVVVLTGYTNLDFSVKSLEMGVSDYLLKDELSPALLHKSILYSIKRRSFADCAKKSETKYKDLFELSPEPMWLIERKSGNFLDVNHAAVDHYGYSREEFLKMREDHIISDESPEIMYTVGNGVGAGFDDADDKYLNHRKKSGDVITVKIATSDIPYGGGDARLVLADDITEKLRAEKQLLASLNEKEVLLAEIHHRVKNNLALVSGMLQMQVFDEDNEEVINKLNNSMLRVETMASIHQLLYESSSFSRLEFSKIINKLIKATHDSFSAGKDIDIEIETDPFELNINQAVPCSLIINEAITNVYKHAFKNRRRGWIKAVLRSEDDLVTFTIEDDGNGLPEDFDISELTSLGIKIITALMKQLNGMFELVPRDGGGTIFKLEFPVEKKKRPVNLMD